MPHITTPEAEALMHVPLNTLDHGHVMLIDYAGGDDRIVAAARTSYGAGTKTKREDAQLIDYLMRNRHTSPFEQVILWFHIKLPLFVFGHFVRHRTARLNVMSARYSVMKDEFYIPKATQWRAQSATNKQVGEGQLEHGVGTRATNLTNKVGRYAYDAYNEMLHLGVAREQARMVLPQNLYTECVWQIDLHNLFHLLGLRLDKHAQSETQEYAQHLARCAEAVAPEAYIAFMKHVKKNYAK